MGHIQLDAGREAALMLLGLTQAWQGTVPGVKGPQNWRPWPGGSKRSTMPCTSLTCHQGAQQQDTNVRPWDSALQGAFWVQTLRGVRLLWWFLLYPEEAGDFKVLGGQGKACSRSMRQPPPSSLVTAASLGRRGAEDQGA